MSEDILYHVDKELILPFWSFKSLINFIFFKTSGKKTLLLSSILTIVSLYLSGQLIDVFPLYAAVGNFSAIFLFPLLMYYCKLGVTGAAISTVISQYVSCPFLLQAFYL